MAKRPRNATVELMLDLDLVKKLDDIADKANVTRDELIQVLLVLELDKVGVFNKKEEE